MTRIPNASRKKPGRRLPAVSSAFLCMLVAGSAWPETLAGSLDKQPGGLRLSLTRALPALQSGSSSRPPPVAQPATGQDGVKMNLQPAESLPSAGSTPKEAAPQPQDLLSQARYWESRGRSDLAAKLRSQTQAAPEAAKPVPRPAPPTAAVSRPAVAPPETPAPRAFVMSENMTATSGQSRSPQEMDKQARYWQERGREDLAGEIQQKLQTLQTAQPVRIIPPVTRAEAPQSPAHTGNDAPQAVALRPALETSLQNSPDSPDTRMHLAQIYRSTGEYHKARAQIESVLAARPDLPAALHASAQLYADQRLWREALDTLEKISPVSRTQEMANLQKMAWAHIQLDRAEALVRQGRDAEAKVLLRRVALELSIDVDQPLMAEPPPLWKPNPADTRKNR